MKIFSWNDVCNFNQPRVFENVALTIGVFDGVHVGHQALLASVLEKKITSGVVTFSDNISSRLHKKDHAILTDDEEKINLLSDLGFDFIVLIDFSDNFGKLSCRDFIHKLNNFIEMKSIVVGSDFRCGHKGEADVTLLGKILNDYGVELEILSKIMDNSANEVSSSLIKGFLRKGEMHLVNELLGYRYSFFLKDYEVDGDFLIINRKKIKKLLPCEGLFQVKDNLSRDCLLVIEKERIFINKPEGEIPKRIIF
ncbi:MAG: FAD synthetase family protein [Spirochaetales bacterium]|nr:FAD synthetase family protein [Spirochaetales bacterium]